MIASSRRSRQFFPLHARSSLPICSSVRASTGFWRSGTGFTSRMASASNPSSRDSHRQNCFSPASRNRIEAAHCPPSLASHSMTAPLSSTSEVLRKDSTARLYERMVWASCRWLSVRATRTTADVKIDS